MHIYSINGYKFKNLKIQSLSRSEYNAALKIEKMKLKEVLNLNSTKYEEEQNTVLETEVREYQRQLLRQYHTTENDLISNVCIVLRTERSIIP